MSRSYNEGGGSFSLHFFSQVYTHLFTVNYQDSYHKPKCSPSSPSLVYFHQLNQGCVKDRVPIYQNVSGNPATSHALFPVIFNPLTVQKVSSDPVFEVGQLLKGNTFNGSEY